MGLFVFRIKKCVKFGVTVPASCGEFLTQWYSSCPAQLATNINIKFFNQENIFLFIHYTKKSKAAGISNKHKKKVGSLITGYLFFWNLANKMYAIVLDKGKHEHSENMYGLAAFNLVNSNMKIR